MQVTIQLSAQAAAQLRQIAVNERRRVKDQIAIIVEQAVLGGRQQQEAATRNE